MKKILLLLLPCLLIVSCCPPEFDDSVKTIKFDRLFMNESDRYTMIVDGKPFEIYSRGPIKFYYDVPKNEKSYLHFKKVCTGMGDITIPYLYFHLHSVNEIGGGGWDHGKFGHGQTNTVE